MGAEAWSALANVILALAAVAGSVAAFGGLRTWKSQQTWHNDHDLALQTLIAAYNYRDKLFTIRDPYVSNDEMVPSSATHQRKMETEEDLFDGMSVAYARRWQSLNQVRAGLSATLIETEALWGCDLSNYFKKLHGLEQELRSNTIRKLKLLNSHLDESSKSAVRDLKSKFRDILYDKFSDDDEFRNEFSTGLTSIETFLGKKLGRNP